MQGSLSIERMCQIGASESGKLLPFTEANRCRPKKTWKCDRRFTASSWSTAGVMATGG